ncbi:MAG TPA: hypothetical protein VLB84_03825 [Bacteroidia bacterium]|nr:hypothetical protein [Bacteroidia bacterium]
MVYDFKINSTEAISSYFLQKEIFSFRQASFFVKQLPYKRNTNKDDHSIVLKDGFGTCSTKHAILKRLALENNKHELQLMLGIFQMNGNNTPRINTLLKKYELPYIPEAHNYLKVNSQIIDCTFPDAPVTNFMTHLTAEISIRPDQITDFKINYHKDYIKTWLISNSWIRYSFNEIWKLREECIHKLSGE